MAAKKKPELPKTLYLTLPRSMRYSGTRERWCLERVPENSVCVWQLLDTDTEGRYQSVVAKYDPSEGWEVSVRVPGPWRLKPLDSLTYRSAPLLPNSPTVAGTLTFRGPVLTVGLHSYETVQTREDGNDYPITYRLSRMQSGVPSNLEIEVIW